MSKLDELTLVIVEDNPADLETLRIALEGANAEPMIMAFENGIDALRYLQSSGSLCDLIILDLNLPRMNGFEILSEIRTIERLGPTTVIIMSGSDHPTEVAECYRRGATACIKKPCYVSEIEMAGSRIAQYLREAEQRRTPAA